MVTSPPRWRRASAAGTPNGPEATTRFIPNHYLGTPARQKRRRPPADRDAGSDTRWMAGDRLLHTAHVSIPRVVGPPRMNRRPRVDVLRVTAGTSGHTQDRRRRSR